MAQLWMDLKQMTRQLHLTRIFLAVVLVASIVGFVADAPPASAASTATITKLAGSTTGTASSLSLDPTAITSDSAGDIYEADGVGHVVRKIDTSGNTSVIAGTGLMGSSTNGVLATATNL